MIATLNIFGKGNGHIIKSRSYNLNYFKFIFQFIYIFVIFYLNKLQIKQYDKRLVKSKPRRWL